MGYRSDVVALMYGKGNTPEDKAMIKEFIRQRVTPELMENFDFDGWGVKFEAEQWKWYSDYDDIKMLEKLFAEYKEAFCEGNYDAAYAFEFARTGEACDDTEMDAAGCNQCRLHVRRTIIVD